jgi:hypothetical protein
VSSAVVQFAAQGIAAESAFFNKVQIYNPAGATVKTIVPTPSYAVPAHLFSPTTLSPTSSINLKAAAAILQDNTKSNAAADPALVDAVLASYTS